MTVVPVDEFRALHYSLPGKRFTGVIHGVFPRALAIEIRGGGLVTLVTRDRLNMPGAVVVDAAAGAFTPAVPGGRAECDGATMRLPGGAVVNYLNAGIWSGRIPIECTRASGELLIRAIGAGMQRRSSFGCRMQNSVHERLREAALSRLKHSIALAAGGLHRKAVDGFGRIVGLGPGSTSAGDDMMIGALAASFARRTSVGCRIGNAIMEAVDCFESRTVPVSRTLLRWSAAGEFGEEIVGMIEAVSGTAGTAGTAGTSESPGDRSIPAVESAVSRVTDCGASSGFDTLAGFVETARRGW